MTALHQTVPINSLTSKFSTHLLHDKGHGLIDFIKYKCWKYVIYEPSEVMIRFLKMMMVSNSKTYAGM